jgi:hypothetical protein
VWRDPGGYLPGDLLSRWAGRQVEADYLFVRAVPPHILPVNGHAVGFHFGYVVPFDDKSPFVTSGMRLGTPAVTTRGMQEADMDTIAQLIDDALMANADDARLASIKTEVNTLMKRFPLYA